MDDFNIQGNPTDFGFLSVFFWVVIFPVGLVSLVEYFHIW